MKCNWCGQGSGKAYTKDKDGKIYYYYCQACVGDYTNGIEFKPIEDPLHCINYDICKKQFGSTTTTDSEVIACGSKICPHFEEFARMLKEGS